MAKLYLLITKKVVFLKKEMCKRCMLDFRLLRCIEISIIVGFFLISVFRYLNLKKTEISIISKSIRCYRYCANAEADYH